MGRHADSRRDSAALLERWPGGPTLPISEFHFSPPGRFTLTKV
jgi:hypothetical protein